MPCVPLPTQAGNAIGTNGGSLAGDDERQGLDVLALAIDDAAFAIDGAGFEDAENAAMANPPAAV